VLGSLARIRQEEGVTEPVVGSATNELHPGLSRGRKQVSSNTRSGILEEIIMWE